MSKEPQDKPQSVKLQPKYLLPSGGRFRQTVLIGRAYADALAKNSDAIAAAKTRSTTTGKLSDKKRTSRAPIDAPAWRLLVLG